MRADGKAGLSPKRPIDLLIANLGTLGVGRCSVEDVDELGVVLCHELGCDAGADSAVTKVLADRLTRDGQQALRRCRSHSPSGHQPKPADLYPDGRKGSRAGGGLPPPVGDSSFSSRGEAAGPAVRAVSACSDRTHRGSMQAKDGVTEQDFRNCDERKAGSAWV